MQFKPIIFIMAIVLGVLLSGCTGGQDVTSIVKALPEVQQFLKENPNAKITVTYWSKEEVAKSIQEISQQCGKSITPVAMYRATVIDPDSGIGVLSWIDAENGILICSSTEKLSYGEDITVSQHPATVTPDTVLLDDFNGATKGTGFGALTYEDSLPNLGKAVNLANGTYIKYSFSPWYKWDEAHKWDRNEAAPGVLTEGTIELWIKPRQYSGILNFNWGDAVSSPPAGHIMHFGFNADGKLTYSVWGGNLDKGLVGKTTIPLNKWTHVAVSWSPYGTKLYVNGEVDASTSANVWPAFSGTVFAYLNYWGGNGLGVVDELHISKVAEPPTIVTPTITPPPPPPPPPPKNR